MVFVLKVSISQLKSNHNTSIIELMLNIIKSAERIFGMRIGRQMQLQGIIIFNYFHLQKYPTQS